MKFIKYLNFLKRTPSYFFHNERDIEIIKDTKSFNLILLNFFYIFVSEQGRPYFIFLYLFLYQKKADHIL